MDNKDQKRGFSGLIDLTSDSGTFSQVQAAASSVSFRPTTSEKKMFALLELKNWPTLPAPWSSVDSGETWVWGDFFLTFQKKPKTVLDLAMEIQGKKAEDQGMTYHYAMSVFYRIDRNPHGPSHRPIMTVVLEQADMSIMAKMLGSEARELLQSEADSKMGPLKLGLFSSEAHFNFGEYKEDVTPQALRKRFFEILSSQLRLCGQPKKIGNLAQAHGHPETGLPIKKKNNCSGKSGGGSGKTWILGLLAVIFVILLANHAVESTKKSSKKPPPPAQNYNLSQSSPAPITQPNKSQSAGLQYEKPPVGTNRVLSVPQIRWCVREGIRIETMRDSIDSNYGVEEFNRIVNDYNHRCKSYQYRRGSLKRAQREVEANRTQIVDEAIRDAEKLGRAHQPSYPSVSSGKSTTATKDPRPQFTRETQRLLAALGYDPGPVDGLFGRRTTDAVKAFQKDAGLSQDGKIDEDLLNSLLRRKARVRAVETSSTPEREQSDATLFNQPSQVLPMNGWIQKYHSGESIAPLRIKTRSAEQHYFVKIEDFLSGKLILTVFVRGGASIDLNVPLGSYKLKYAGGKTWYGTTYLFGPKTAYSKADKRFDFSVIGNQVSGYTVELYLQRDGNLRMTHISASDF